MATSITHRRRPVPREWREDNHELNVSSRYYSQRSWTKFYRATGKCSCGQKFGEAAGEHGMDRAAVIDAHKDHVEAAYYSEKEERSQP